MMRFVLVNNKKAYKVIVFLLCLTATKSIFDSKSKDIDEIQIKNNSAQEVKENAEATSYSSVRQLVPLGTLASSVEELNESINYSQVKGFVFDKNGNPAPFTEIEFRPRGRLNNLESVFSYTNQDGEYARSIIPGEYEIYCYNVTKSLTESVIIDNINITNKSIFYYDVYLPNGYELKGVIDMQLSFFQEIGDTPYQIQIYLYGSENPVYGGITEFPGDNDDYKPGRFKVENLYPGQYTLRVLVGELNQSLIYFDKPFSISSHDCDIGYVVVDESSIETKYK